MRSVGRKSLNGDDPVARTHVCDADGTGALHLVVDMHGAGAALRDAAAIFRASEADLLADHPQEWGVRFRLHVTNTAINVELCHERPLASSFDDFLVALRRCRATTKKLKAPARC